MAVRDQTPDYRLQKPTLVDATSFKPCGMVLVPLQSCNYMQPNTWAIIWDIASSLLCFQKLSCLKELNTLKYQINNFSFSLTIWERANTIYWNLSNRLSYQVIYKWIYKIIRVITKKIVNQANYNTVVSLTSYKRGIISSTKMEGLGDPLLVIVLMPFTTILLMEQHQFVQLFFTIVFYI